MSIPTRWAIWMALSFSPSGIVYSLLLMMMVAMGFLAMPSSHGSGAFDRRCPVSVTCEPW